MNKTRESLGFYSWHLFCQDALEMTSYRSHSRPVSLGKLGSVCSLLCGEKRCENDHRSFSLVRRLEPPRQGTVGSNQEWRIQRKEKTASRMGYRFSLRCVDKKDASSKWRKFLYIKGFQQFLKYFQRFFRV